MIVAGKPLGNVLEQPGDDSIRGDAIGAGILVRDHAVPQHGMCNRADVARRNRFSTAQRARTLAAKAIW